MPHSQVDEQVVKMSFDNSNFDGNINDSIRALNNLDTKLGIISKNNFSSLTTNIDNLAKTFSVKGQIMFGVLTTLGNKIVNLGTQAFRKLTQGIRDGIGEYNTIIESTESIYQNVKQNGNSLQDVNNALDELNDYADKTIYNFGQMTRMIGMFASAGVGLKSSVSTIKGLANSAALVGANMQKAQMAWNAVSRAMSSGRFTNVTWRSLELSGIAGKQFNKVITEVARTMKVKGKQTGKDIDGMIKKWGSLRESLREGWLTKDVFTEAMDIMSGAMDEADLKRKGYTKKQIKELRDIAKAAEEAATRVKTFKQLMDTIGEAIGSGWAQSFRILIGDLEDAKKLYTRISNVISDFIDNNAEIRNQLFTKIVNGKDKGVFGKWRSGRDNFRQIIENILAIVKTFLKSVKTGFLNIFPIDRIAAAGRKVLEVVEKFTRSFVLNMGEIKAAGNGDTLWNTDEIDAMTESVENLIKFFRGLASAVDIAWMAISQPIKSIIKHIPFFDNFYDNTNTSFLGIIKKLGVFGDKITAFRDAVKDFEIFGYLTDYFLDNIDELGKKYPILGAILWVFNGVKSALVNVRKAFKELNIKPLSVVFGTFKMVVTSVWRILNGLFGLLRNAKNSIDWSWLEGPKRILINTLKTLSDYGRGLINFEQATGKIGGVLGSLFSKLGNIFNKTDVVNKVKTTSYEINKQYSNLNVTIDRTGKKVQSVWDKIKGFFSPILDFFKSIEFNGNLTFDNFAKKFALIGGGVAAATISVSHLVKTFGKIKIIDNLNNLLTAGIDVVKAYQREAQSKAILNIAVAIGILAVSMAALSFIPYDRLENGLVIFTSFMAILAMTLPPIINAMAKFNESVVKMNDSEKPINALIKTLGKFGKQIASGINARLIGKMFKDIAVGLFILVGAIAALTMLFKYDRDNTITAIIALAKVLGILAAAVIAITIAVNLFSKSYKDSSTSVGVFAQFFKLSGVAKIILSLSAAVLVLVGALAIMTKLDSGRLYESWALLMSIIGFLGLITIAVAAITSRAKDMGKLKKITVSITGAVLGVAAIVAAMALLISETKKDNTNSWIKALVMFTAIIGQFTAMTTVLLLVAKKVGGQTTIWTKLEKLMLVMTTCLVAISGVLFLLGYSKPIPASVVTTIGIMTAAMLGIISLLALVAIVTSKAKSTFTTNFVRVIEGISLSIAALIASLGVMIAGVGTLLFTLSSIDISQADANKASSNVVNKLAYIAEVIAKALPELKKLFYNIGTSIGTVFTSFTTGFIDRVISVGETYNNVAEKFVNLVIDIVGKVVTILKSRKEDVARIIGDVVDFLGTELTAALNAFFKKDGKGMFNQEDVTKWAGGILLSAGAVHVLAENAKDLNALVLLFKNIKTIIGDIFNFIAGLHIIKKIGTLISFIEKVYWYLVSVKDVIVQWANVVKLGTKIISVLNTIWNILAVIVGVAGTLIGLISLFVGIAQEWFGVSEHLNTDFAKYDSKLQALKENLTNLGFIFQSFIYGFKQFGMGVVTFFESIGRIVIGFGSLIMTVVIGIVNILVYLVEKIVGLFNKDAAKSINNFRNNVLGTLGDSFLEVNQNQLSKLKDSWQRVFDYPKTEAYKTSKEIAENWNKGGEDGLYAGAKSLAEAATKNAEGVEKAEKKELQINSPSKKSYNIYWNYILGAKNALSNGGQELVKIAKSNNKKLIKATITGAKTLEKAYDKVGAKKDERKGINKYTDIDYTEKNKDGSVNYKRVNLNKELTETILEQTEALRGLSKEEAFSYINQQNMEKGIGASIKEISDLTNVLYDQHEDRSTLYWDSVANLQKATEVGWGAVLSAEEQASMEAVQKQIDTNAMLGESAEELKNKLVGKKKEQAAEIIKQDLIEKGMTEEQAEEESHKMVALIMAQQKNTGKIKLKSLNDSISVMKAEKDAFEKSIEEQTAILEEEMAKQVKARAEAAKATEEMAKGGSVDKNGNYKGMTVSEYIAKQRAKIEADSAVKKAKADLDRIVAETTKILQKNGTFNSRQFQEDYEKAYKEANSTQKKNKSAQETVSDFLKKAFGGVPKGIDTSTWKLPKIGGGGTGQGKDPKTKNPVDAAKKLKGDLEKNRADLTPTFDLDKLAKDASKANGIVMSSLMAAQNASIGDYINKDSELNPFMKDRWQNVYNFTQNNYSPKALSRIDIYRQTERQLGMSRGF